MTLRRDTFALTALLAAITAVAPLSTDLYLPSLPDIGRAFGVPASQVQLTLSVYLMGYAVGQVAYGPLSDRHGRRLGLLIAFSCYCAGSLMCIMAPSIEMLIAARFLQAFGGSGAVVLARAVVRDLYSGARAGRELSLMGMVMSLGPVSAPLIGGILHTAFGWRSAFAALLAFGLIVGFVIWRSLPETLNVRAEPISLRSTLQVYRRMLRHRSFLAYLGIVSASYAGLIAWLSAAPFILQNFYGLSPLIFALTFSMGSLGFLLGALIATRYVVRLGIDRMIGIGAVLMIAGSLAMCSVIGLGMSGAAALVLTMAVYLVGFGMVFPPATAGGLSCFADRAGAASSLLGFTPQFLAALAGASVVGTLNQTAWPVAIAVTLMSLLTLACWATLRSRPQVQA